ncbi:tRNA pseudouridine synthase D, partial [Sphaeroforma arctica JP610]
GIERKTRTLYVHSVQSYVWNKAVTKRQALYGDQVVEGDLVNVPEGEGDEGSKVLVHQHDSKRVGRAWGLGS